jgi:hypothetical protein
MASKTPRIGKDDEEKDWEIELISGINESGIKYRAISTM